MSRTTLQDTNQPIDQPPIEQPPDDQPHIDQPIEQQPIDQRGSKRARFKYLSSTTQRKCSASHDDQG